MGADLFSTMRILALLPENQLAPDGAQTCFPAVAPLRWPGARKNLQCATMRRCMSGLNGCEDEEELMGEIN
jgi:hypothetical protein